MTQQDPQIARRPRPQLRLVRVSRVERLTPHMVRVTVAGDELAGFTTQGPAEHIKVFFPEPGQERPVLPTFEPGRPPTPGQTRPTSRTYTPRAWHPDRLELDIDFVLHSSDGPGSNWAQKAKPGDFVAIAGPSAPYRPDPAADWYLIGGDESALPAIANILEALVPSARASVIVEVENAAEEQALGGPTQTEVTWLHRGHEESTVGQLLEEAMRDVPLPGGQGRLWVGCEASVMRNIRRHLLTERGLTRDAIHTQGYWKYRVANHPDHDLGEDV